jgi:L-rhamnose mutarotase
MHQGVATARKSGVALRLPPQSNATLPAAVLDPIWQIDQASLMTRPIDNLPDMRHLACLLLASILAGCATAPKAPQRFAWVTGLKPEKAEYYKQLHAHPWPGVMRQLKACHVQNYSIYEKEIDGKPYLFSYLEFTGHDFDADMKKMAADPETQRWWKETDPCQSPLPDAAAKGKIWSDTQEVFYLK